MIFPVKALSSKEISDLPPKSLLRDLTHDQRRSWVCWREHWSNIYQVMTFSHCGFPVITTYWKRVDREYVPIEAKYYLLLYDLITLDWGEILEKTVDESQTHFLTPDDVWLSVLRWDSEISFSGCLDGASLSPQRFCKSVRALSGGKINPVGISERVENLSEPITQLKRLFRESSNPEVRMKLKKLRGLEAELMRIDIKVTHESNGFVKGGAWVDGVWYPSKKGKRHNPNPKKYKPSRLSSDWVAAFDGKQRRCQCQVCQIPHRRQVNIDRICFDCYSGVCSIAP